MYLKAYSKNIFIELIIFGKALLEWVYSDPYSFFYRFVDLFLGQGWIQAKLRKFNVTEPEDGVSCLRHEHVVTFCSQVHTF